MPRKPRIALMVFLGTVAALLTMKEHYTKSTIEAQSWCKQCGKNTMHRVDSGRKGPCLTCIERLENERKAQVKLFSDSPKEEQLGLFR